MPHTPARTPMFAARSVPQRLLWLGLALAGALAGAGVLVYQSMERARADFETNARIAHRLLSQRAVQHEAVLLTLGLVQSLRSRELVQVYPQFLQVLQRPADARWPTPDALGAALQAAEKAGTSPQLARADLPQGRFWIVSPRLEGASAQTAYALEIDLQAMVPWEEWPYTNVPTGVPPMAMAARLEYQGQAWPVHAATLDANALRTFDFRKHLASESQPFDLVVEQSYRWGDLPWLAWLLWLAAWGALLAFVAQAQRQRRARKRAEDLLRLGQIARLNALGELAAGLAHELNQPLTAVLANTQAAARLLEGDASEQATARQAMDKATAQAKRAAAVVARLRRVIEKPSTQQSMPVDVASVVRGALELLEPQCRALQLTPIFSTHTNLLALGDSVAMEQIVHNLLANALAALSDVGSRARSLQLVLQASPDAALVQLQVLDNGPGLPADIQAHLFEPFVSGRPGGLGLGLSLCSTLAQERGGTLRFAPLSPGAAFTLELPAAPAKAPSKAQAGAAHAG